MRTGIFGGAFNPPHLGHLIVAECARSALSLDRVLWIPGNDPPHKPSPSAVATDRLRMVQLAVASNEHFVASADEIERGGVSYTVDTLERLASERDGDDLYLIMGADSLVSFEGWYRPSRILELATLAAYPRAGAGEGNARTRLTREAVLLDAPIIEISSTAIRERVSAGTSIRYLVPDAVAEFIRTRLLYKNGS